MDSIFVPLLRCAAHVANVETRAVKRALVTIVTTAVLGLAGPDKLRAGGSAFHEASVSPAAATMAPDLDQLLARKQYLVLNEALRSADALSIPDGEFFRGVLANRCGQIEQSIRLLEAVRTEDPVLLQSKRQKMVLRTLGDDYTKAFRYSDAARTYAQLLRRFASSLGAAEKSDLEGDLATANLLSELPAQTVTLHGNFTVRTKRNAIGLVEAQVTAAGRTQPWILDTGANLSLVTRSRAKELRLTLSKETVPVQVFGGAKVQCHIARIDKVTFGRAILSNVAVLVVEDRDYYIPQVRFQVEALLGYPVLSALERISFVRGGFFRAGAEEAADDLPGAQMLMDGLTVLVAAGAGEGKRLYTLDTGASDTYLTSRYLHDVQPSLAVGKPSEVELAGHALPLPAYYAKSVVLVFGGASATIAHVPVLAGPSDNGEDFFYGNLGQDAFAGFESYTLDFHRMRFLVTASRLLGKTKPAPARPGKEV